jgi:hypothetical protein
MKFAAAAVAALILGIGSGLWYARKTSEIVVPASRTTPKPESAATPTPPVFSPIPAGAFPLKLDGSRGTVTVDRVEDDTKIPATQAGTLRQGDAVTTAEDATARYLGGPLSVTLDPGTAISAVSLIPDRILLALSSGTLGITATGSAAVKAGVLLVSLSSASADLTRNPDTGRITVSLREGTGSAAFVNGDNDTQVEALESGSRIIVDPDTLTVRRVR